MRGPDDAVARAARLAEEELFPRALETDAAPLLPRARLDALAAAGLYGVAGPRELGGAPDLATFCRVLEALASGCLTTAFVFAQHHNAVRTLAGAPADLPARRLLEPLCRGDVRAGVAYSALRRPGPPLLSARPVGASFVLDGRAPWVSGFGLVDVVHVAALTDDGRVVWGLVDAAEGPTLVARPLPLLALGASGTVELAFAGHRLAAERVTLVEPLEAWRRRDALGLRPNGSLALGVARRAAALGGLGALAAEGARGALASSHAARLGREALVLLAFGQTPAIREALRHRLARRAPT